MSQTMRQFKYLFSISLLLQIISGCSESSSNKNFNEGTIEYSIEFSGIEKSSFNTSMLPEKLTIKFRDNNTSNKIEGLKGKVNLSFINNVKDHNFIILANLLGKKLYYQDSLLKKNLPNVFLGMPDISIQKTDEVFHYKGFNCKKAIARYNDNSDYSFEILYTNDINIVNPNANTPFESIDGVMLKFSIKLNTHIMNISAISIMQEDISMDEFAVPQGYEKMPKRTIDDLFSLIH
jgi:hypothetical protein